MKTTHDFGKVLAKELAEDPELEMLVEQQRLHSSIAREIYAARQSAEMTQKELAAAASMSQPGVARMEDADYEGHSVNALHKIAWVLGKKVVVEFVDRPKLIASAQKRISTIWEEDLTTLTWQVVAAPSF
jgi:transcriptional regulator with XRE-family HTH domain